MAKWLAWILAVFAFVGGLGAAWSMMRFPSALASSPMSAQAQVTDSFINGFGGDPAVDYRYSVNGKEFTGWGTGGRGYPDLLTVAPGATIPIKYARAAPWESCMCYPTSEAPTPVGYVVDAAFMLPLPLLAIRAWRRRRWRRHLTPEGVA